jgi:hypothetical protein
VGNDEHSLLQPLLQLGDQFLIGSGLQNLARPVGHGNKDESFILFVGDFLSAVDEDGGSELLVFGIQVSGGLNEGGSNLVLKVGEIAAFDALGLLEHIMNFAGIGHCGKSDFIKLIFNRFSFFI